MQPSATEHPHAQTPGGNAPAGAPCAHGELCFPPVTPNVSSKRKSFHHPHRSPVRQSHGV
eukprot:712278-Pleurochrysis_carterae.AAC.1